MSHLDLAEFRRFCKEKIIFTFNMVLVYTLYSVVCISLENKQSNKANIKHIEDVHVSFILFFIISLILVVHCITTFCHNLLIHIYITLFPTPSRTTQNVGRNVVGKQQGHVAEVRIPF